MLLSDYSSNKILDNLFKRRPQKCSWSKIYSFRANRSCLLSKNKLPLKAETTAWGATTLSSYFFVIKLYYEKTKYYSRV